MGTKAGTYHFRYDQPDLIDRDEKLSSNIASLKVDWEFNGGRIVGRFTVDRQVRGYARGFPPRTPHCRDAFAHDSRQLPGARRRSPIAAK